MSPSVADVAVKAAFSNQLLPIIIEKQNGYILSKHREYYMRSLQEASWHMILNNKKELQQKLSLPLAYQTESIITTVSASLSQTPSLPKTIS